MKTLNDTSSKFISYYSYFEVWIYSFVSIINQSKRTRILLNIFNKSSCYNKISVCYEKSGHKIIGWCIN